MVKTMSQAELTGDIQTSHMSNLQTGFQTEAQTEHTKQVKQIR